MCSFLVKRYDVAYFLVKQMCNLAHNVHQLLFSARFFALTQFTMLNGSHMDAHIIYDLTVVHLFKCILNLGPALLICYGPRATLIRHWF